MNSLSRRSRQLLLLGLALMLLGAGLAVRAQNGHTRRASAVRVSVPAAIADRHGLLGLDTAQLRARGFNDAAEVELIETYQLVADGRLHEALARSERLASRYPNFALAQLLRGDLLRAEAGRLRHFADARVPAADTAELDGLVREARARLAAYADAPDPDQLPSNFVALGPRVAHAIVVDTGASRLYLFGRDARGQMHLVANYYVTQGKLGADKQRDGDLRTPLGVYFITRAVGQRWLAAVYGAGAMPLNYPKAWDRLLGRTGGGIWLHGVPSDVYARPPLASNGCVVLANTDLLSLMSMVEPDTTPVVITAHIDWMSPAQLAQRRAELRATLARAAPHAHTPDSTLLYFHGKHELLVMQYPGQRDDKPITHRDYWTKENGRWRLFHAGVLS
jgi:hypothetical protein